MADMTPELRRQMDALMRFGNDFVEILPTPPVVDLLGDLACSPVEVKRRQNVRLLRNVLGTPVQLGISSRGVKPK